MDLLTNSSNLTISLIPVAALATGLMGGLHCVGMCGPLISSVNKKKKDIYLYQVGRLTGYLILALIAGSLGLKVSQLGPKISLWGGISLGLMFLIWGGQGFFRSSIKKGGFFATLSQKIFARFLPNVLKSKNSYLFGLLSLFLPCGLLYGVILVSLGLGGPLKAVMALFFFWLGTIPALSGLAYIIQLFLRPIREKYPRTSSLLLVTVGLVTIFIRVQSALFSTGVHQCH